MGYGVLREDSETVGGDHIGDAVVDLRIDVVRTSRKDDAVFSGVFYCKTSSPFFSTSFLAWASSSQAFLAAFFVSDSGISNSFLKTS